MCISALQDSTVLSFSSAVTLLPHRAMRKSVVDVSVDIRWTPVDTFFLDGREMQRGRFRPTTTFGVGGHTLEEGAGAGPCETSMASPPSDPKFGRLKGAVGCRQ